MTEGYTEDDVTGLRVGHRESGHLVIELRGGADTDRPHKNDEEVIMNFNFSLDQAEGLLEDMVITMERVRKLNREKGED